MGIFSFTQMCVFFRLLYIDFFPSRRIFYSTSVVLFFLSIAFFARALLSARVVAGATICLQLGGFFVVYAEVGKILVHRNYFNFKVFSKKCRPKYLKCKKKYENLFLKSIYKYLKKKYVI